VVHELPRYTRHGGPGRKTCSSLRVRARGSLLQNCFVLIF
jgi:hypothetical protein